MSFARFRAVYALELKGALRRPLLWMLLLIVVLLAFGMALGNVQVGTGDSAVGGKKAWFTSEFAFARDFSVVSFMLYSFFVAVAAGMAVIQDDEWRTGELFHSTPLRPAEYLLGKFLGALTPIAAAMVIHVALTMFFQYSLPRSRGEEIRGPFAITHYLRPLLLFAIPNLLAVGGLAFALGIFTRRPILVFLLPVALIMGCGFFLWSYSPAGMYPPLNRILMFLDPCGFRWLYQTWLKSDRGVDFYNNSPIPLDRLILGNRLFFLGIAGAAFALALARFTRTIRGSGRVSLQRWPAQAGGDPTAAPALLAPLRDLGMESHRPGYLASVFAMARIELRELSTQPGLYLFVPLILLQAYETATETRDPQFGNHLLLTSGTIAVGTLNILTTLVVLLLLFYTTESIRREENCGLAPIVGSAPVAGSALLLGKSLANSAVAFAVLLAGFAGSAIAMAHQRVVRFEAWPFALVWGLLALPTFFLWTTFVAALYAITKNRYATYALGLGAIVLTAYLRLRGDINWIGNWTLWGALKWSDMGTFDLDRSAILWNRILVLATGIFFLAIAVRFMPRRDTDPILSLLRLRPASWLRRSPRWIALAALPAIAAIVLGSQVARGFQGGAARERAKDYWRRNVGTWRDAPLPDLSRVEIDLALDPPNRGFKVEGEYVLVNHYDMPMQQFALTRGLRWESIEWKPAAECEVEDRSGLVVFTPKAPLPTEGAFRVRFKYGGTFPQGVTRDGGGTSEFILPCGVVVTSFASSVFPVVGLVEGLGVDSDNRFEPRVYPVDGYLGITEPAFGSATGFSTRIRVSGPQEYTFNSVGVLTSNEVEGSVRTMTWESEHPVRFFNVVGGRYAVRRGEGAAVYYHPSHTYNIDEMLEGLAGARKWYSEWFAPYPWKELKISEFPALEAYAQGFPTNIPFSESIGFLIEEVPGSSLTMMVTAHEAAHQWWGNIVTPGKFPGANILSEGMAHFSTALLFEQLRGPRGRIEFLKRIEERYDNNRRVDSERPLVRIDGSKDGDTTVTYDKGGWVFWMVLRHMGRERCLEGLRDFIGKTRNGPDFPVLQDYLAVMRRYAPDPASFDRFTHPWFYETTIPEYQFSDVTRTPLGAPDAKTFEVRGKLKNVGTATMPIVVSAASAPESEAFEKNGSWRAGYQDSRATLILGPDEEKEFVLRCAFKPVRVLVDPEAWVFQAHRERAVHEF